MIDEDFLYMLQNSITGVPSGTAVEKGVVSEEMPSTRIYFQRSDSEQDLMLNGNQALTTTVFDVEVAALDDNAVQPLAKSLKDVLNGYMGAFGSNYADTANHSVALGMFVSDHSDDYQPRVVDADDGYHVAAFQTKIIHL